MDWHDGVGLQADLDAARADLEFTERLKLRVVEDKPILDRLSRGEALTDDIRQAATEAVHDHKFGPSYPEAGQLADAVLAAVVPLLRAHILKTEAADYVGLAILERARMARGDDYA
jgi:hypothetical protein